jgi:hypothetical protein
MAHAKFNIESYVNDLAKTVLDTQPVAEEESVSLESVLSGLVIELWSDPAGRLFIVADEDDAQRLGEPARRIEKLGRFIVRTSPARN